MSKTINITTLAKAEENTRYAARKALEAFVKASPATQQAARDHFDSASSEHERARDRLHRAEGLADDTYLPVRDERSVRVGYARGVYGLGSAHSFAKDTRTVQNGDREALERIKADAQETYRAGGMSEGQLRAIAETAGSGGELVAPLPYQEALIRAAHSDRPYVASLGVRPLPDHHNVLEIPDLKSGGSTGAQSDLSEPSTASSVTTAKVEVNVITVSANLEVARELYDRALPELADGVFFPDLTASYLATSDVQAISGSGSLPNATGVLNTSEINEIAFTSASPKYSELLLAIGEAFNSTYKERKKSANLIMMHPRRWAWIFSNVDKEEQPVLRTHAFTPEQAEQLRGSEGIAGTPVGSIGGMLVVLDPNLPTNLGAGTNQDCIVVQRAEDSWYLEGPVRVQVSEDTSLLSTGAIRLSMWGYAAVIHSRYPKGINVVHGTGLTPPSL